MIDQSYQRKTLINEMAINTIDLLLQKLARPKVKKFSEGNVYIFATVQIEQQEEIEIRGEGKILNQNLIDYMTSRGDIQMKRGIMGEMRRKEQCQKEKKHRVL